MFSDLKGNFTLKNKESNSRCTKSLQKNSYLVSGAMPLFFVTRWPECYLDDNGIEELPGAYASKNMMVIQQSFKNVKMY